MLWTWHYMIMLLCDFQELIEKLSKGELPKNEFACMNAPSSTANGNAQGVSARTTQVQQPHSMRSRRTPTWAKPRHSDDGTSRYYDIYSFSSGYVVAWLFIRLFILLLTHHHKFLDLGCIMLFLCWLC